MLIMDHNFSVSFVICILIERTEQVALLSLSSCCIVTVSFFVARGLVLVLPDHTHVLNVNFVLCIL